MTGKHPDAQRYCQLLRAEAPGGYRHPMRLACHLADGRSLTDGARARRARSGRLAHTLGGVLALAMMLLIGGCKDAAKVAAAPEPPEVEVTQVVQKDVPIYSEWVGTTVGYVTAQIRARITGYLMSQNYTEGSFVKTGDVLFRIDPRPYQATVDQDEANLGQAQAQLEQSRAQLAQANAQVEQAKAQVAQAVAAVTQAEANQRKTQLDVDKYTPLVKDGSVSQQEYDTAVQNNLANKAAIESARANVEAARANLLRMQANVKQAQANITTAQANVQAAKAALYNAQLNARWTLVTSPIDGLAGLRNIDLGEVVNQDQTVLTTVSTIDPIYVDFQISEDAYLRYKTAAAGTFQRVEDIPLELILADGTIFPHRGRFNALGLDVGLTTGTFRVRSEFPNPEALLRPGQFAKVRYALRLKTGALLVPQRAVQDLQGNFQVGVVGPDDTVEIRSVKVGPRVGSLWVITEGLKPGERVIVAGLQNVRAGAVVKASPVDAEPAAAGVQPVAESTKGAPAQTGAASQGHPSN
jgi:membrane fusion protein, multidrug efflux system